MWGFASLMFWRSPTRQALTELRRVIRPAGELGFYEHVRSGGAQAGPATDRAIGCGRCWAAAVTAIATRYWP